MNPKEFVGLEDDVTEKLNEYEKIAEEDAQGENAETENSDPPMSPEVVNIVACVDYGCPLDLLIIATHSRNAEYNPKRFPAVTLRIQEPKATGLTFKNGKMNIVGCRTEEAAYLAARKFGRMLKNLNFPVKLKSFSIANIVAKMDCKFPIHLETFAREHQLFATYNPEVFAGLIYRVVTPKKATFLVFVSGKIVVTGVKSIENIVEASNSLYPILQQYAGKYYPDAE